ncbi:MAG: DMT family transporter [Chitinophagia bacterium]|nr:DMT family transporter [Chitinophagia bacterium]
MSDRLRAHASVLTANLIFAVNYTIVKMVTPGLIGPFGQNVVRVLSTVAITWMLLPFEKGSWRPDREDVASLLLCGLTGVCINQLLFIKGLSMTQVMHATLIQLTTPVVITLIAYLLFGERLGVVRMAGLVCGIGGAAWLITGRAGSRVGGNDALIGDVFVMLNSVSYSFYFVTVKPLMRKYSPAQVMRWVFTVGTLGILPFGWGEFVAAPWADFTAVQLLAIAFVAVMATWLAYVLNIHALSHLSPSATGSYIYIQPLVAAAVAAVFLGESFTWRHIVSGLAIFLGVYLVNRPEGRNETR